MGDVERALARTAASTEFGLLTTTHLGRLGLDAGSIRRRCDAGTLHRVSHGVYSLEPPEWIDRLRAIVRLRLAGKAVASHRSAARLHGLWTGDDLDVTIRYPSRARASGAHIHRSRDLVAGVLRGVDGIPTTSVARTLCDLGLVLPPWDVRRMVEHAVATGRVSVTEIESVRWGVSEHGRNGVSAIDQSLAAMPARGSHAESGPELRLMALLEEADLPRVCPQFEVRVAGRTYRLDFAFPHAKVAVEYDGEAFHSSPAQLRRDAARQRHLEDAGWRVLRFDRTHLYTAADGAILRAVADALRSRRDEDL
ncbi:MAG: DUF559 domain-containing protein [Actinomycetota bacterium]